MAKSAGKSLELTAKIPLSFITARHVRHGIAVAALAREAVIPLQPLSNQHYQRSSVSAAVSAQKL